MAHREGSGGEPGQEGRLEYNTGAAGVKGSDFHCKHIVSDGRNIRSSSLQ